MQNARHFAVLSGCCSETEVSEQLSYTKWQGNLFEKMTVEELSKKQQNIEKVTIHK
jgi:hypothetical protein